MMRSEQDFMRDWVAQIQAEQGSRLGDEDLRRVALAAAHELVSRMPEEAIHRGVLPSDSLAACRQRQAMHRAIKDAEIHPSLGQPTADE
jgi:hypothetical protein